MPKHSTRLFRFWNELRRRNVLRSLAIYAGSAFVILEASTIIFPRWDLPDWTIDLVLWLLILGALITLLLAWIFDITPEGVLKTKPLEEVQPDVKYKESGGWKVATYISLVVIVALIVFNVVPTKQIKAGDIQSLVILPFDNFTGDEQLDYFVSGMHASLIGDVGKLGGLQVKSRTSSNAFKGMDMTIPEIASKLGADAALETAVMCLGDTICLQFRLVSTTGDEKQLWVADFKEEKSQILNLYNRITKQIAEEVKYELTADERRQLEKLQTVNKEAYDNFLKSYAYWGDLSTESMQKAYEYLNQALAKDSGWAPLYAGMAQYWAGQMQTGRVDPITARQKIHENILKASELDPDFADSHFINGIISIWTDWDWEKGEKELLKALAINPSDAMSRIYYAHLLMILQRGDEALTQGQLAVDLDPMNPLILGLYSIVLSSAGEFQEAYQLVQKALSIDPDHWFALAQLGPSLYQLGEYDKAFEQAKNYLSDFFSEDLIRSIDAIYREQGRLAAYGEMTRQLELFAQNNYFQPGALAVKYCQTGQYTKALDALEKAYEMHEPNMPYLATGTEDYSGLYDSLRFIAMLDRMNLPHPKDR